MFSIINGLFLRPPAVKSPEQLVVLTTEMAASAQLGNFSYSDYRDLREQADAFTGFAAYELGLVGLSADGRAEQFLVSYVSGDFFSVLGLKPTLGRLTSVWMKGCLPTPSGLRY